MTTKTYETKISKQTNRQTNKHTYIHACVYIYTHTLTHSRIKINAAEQLILEQTGKLPQLLAARSPARTFTNRGPNDHINTRIRTMVSGIRLVSGLGTRT